jgi:hypothetical protein
MATFTLRATVRAPIDTVFDVLTDHRGYDRITPLRSSTLEREGDPAPNGVGAVRRLALVGPPIREEVTEFKSPSRFAYKALSGVPARSHSGTVELSSQANATSVTWRIDSVPKVPMPDAMWAAAMRPVINTLLRGIVKESERRAVGRV